MKNCLCQKLVRLIVIVLLASTTQPVDAAKRERLKIGWAGARNMTPTKTVTLRDWRKVPRVAKAPHTRGPITVSALALESESGDEQLIHVSMDVVYAHGFWISAIKKNLGTRLEGFDLDNLIVSGTHIHTQPLETDEFNASLARIAADAIADAWESRRFGGVSWQQARADIGWCRIVVFKNGGAEMYGNPFRGDFSHMLSEPDTRIPVLFTYDTAGRLTGIVINVSSPAQIVESQPAVSPDYWGVVRDKIAEQIDSGVAVLVLNGAGGDMAPRDLQDNQIGNDMKRSWPGLEYFGGRVFDAVRSQLDSAKSNIETEVVFQHRSHVIKLAKKPEHGEGTVATESHEYRIGDFAMSTTPFELYVDYGNEIKAKSPAEITVVTGYSNRLESDGSGGYLPTQEAVDHTPQAYGARPENGPVGPKGGAQLVEHALRQLNEMFDEPVVTPASGGNGSLTPRGDLRGN